MEKEKNNEEYLSSSVVLHLPFHWSAGPYLGRFYTELRDKGKLWASRCSRCRRLLLPPRIICGVCHLKAPQWPDWIELSGKGSLRDWEEVLASQMDPSTGEIRPEPYLHGDILLDEGVSLLHYLEEKDKENLKVGMRVEMVLKPKKDRRGEITDILYFRSITD